VTTLVSNGVSPAFVPVALGSRPFVDVGGPLITRVNAVNVFWPALAGFPAVDVSVTTNAGAFVTDILLSPWWSGVLRSYGRGSTSFSNGNFSGNYFLSNVVVTSAALTSKIVATELFRQINSGTLPVPNQQTVFVVHFPADIQIANLQPDGITPYGTTCNVGGGYCGFHANANGLVNGQPTFFPFTVHPDFFYGSNNCSRVCGAVGSAQDIYFTGVGHELIEAATNPGLNNFQSQQAWVYRNPSNGYYEEISDMCLGVFYMPRVTGPSVNHSRWLIQAVYSNCAFGCVAFNGSEVFVFCSCLQLAPSVVVLIATLFALAF
jgi:hypothetical protein